MRLSASIFGVNNLSARLPAILGAVIYIISAFRLSVLLAGRRSIQILLLAYLLYNPMILDYLVAARGYSLAIGFFLAAATCLPGLLLGFALCASVVWNWPKGELYFGSQNMFDMWRGFAAGSFDRLNANILNPLLLRWFSRFHSLGPWLFAITGFALLGNMEVIRRRKPEPNLAALADFVRLATLIFAVTLLLHWLAYRIFQIPLPKDRTGLFFIPLWTLIFAGSLIFALRQSSTAILRYTGLAVLAITAFYFVGCLRLGYFREWRFDSDTKTLYWIMADLHRRCGVEKFGIDWRYHTPLNFYRREYGPRDLKEFSASTSGELPADRDAYAIFFATSQDFILRQNLQVIYHNEDSGAAVAIHPCPAP